MTTQTKTEELDSLISTMTGLLKTAIEARDALRDERAKLMAGTSVTPTEAMAVLRAHALQCVKERREVRFYDSAFYTTATFIEEFKSGNDIYCSWKVYRSGSNGGHETRIEEKALIKDIENEARMFPLNLEQGKL